MSKKWTITLWGCNIALYIANIILACIKGPTLATCIFGWVVAIALAGLIIFLQFNSIHKDEVIKEKDHLFEDATNNSIEWLKAFCRVEKKNKKLTEEIRKLKAEAEAKNQAQDGEKK